MKKQTYTDVFIRFILVSALILVSGYLAACSGKDSGSNSVAMSPTAVAPSVESAKEKNMADGKMMDRCMEMKKQKQAMMTDMKAQDAELTLQLAKMNSTPKNEKVTMMAAIITSMVEQRITMEARKAKMEEEMMQHMMQHMQMGKDSMMQCPMMKDMKAMKGMDEKSMDMKKD